MSEGWGFPLGSKKYHYFVDGMSLCNRYGFYHSHLEEGMDDSPDNCTECRKRLAKRRAKTT